MNQPQLWTAPFKHEILDLLRKLRDERNMGMIFITHDLGVIAESDEVARNVPR